MTWLVVVCGIANVFIGVWIGWTRGYAAGRICGQQDALLRALTRRGARLARERWERDRIEPEEGDDEDF